MPRGNFVRGLPAGPAGGLSRGGPAAGLLTMTQAATDTVPCSYDGQAQRYADRGTSYDGVVGSTRLIK